MQFFLSYRTKQQNLSTKDNKNDKMAKQTFSSLFIYHLNTWNQIAFDSSKHSTQIENLLVRTTIEASEIEKDEILKFVLKKTWYENQKHKH